MKMAILLRGLLLSLSLLIALPSIAHHGWSEYEQTKLIKLSGKVIQNGYEHPHGFIKLSADGKEWIAVLAHPFGWKIGVYSKRILRMVPRSL